MKSKQEKLGEPQRILVIPREHGAWFMLLLALFVGAGAARSFNVAFVFLVLFTVAFYCSVYSLGEGIKKASAGKDIKREILSSSIYFLLASIFAAPLFFIYRLWSLIYLALLAAPFFLIYLYLILSRKHRSTWGEIVNISGISFPAAAAYYISADSWSNTSILLWLLTFLYSAASVFYVRLKVRQKVPHKASFEQRLTAGRGLLVYLGILYCLLLGLIVLGIIPFALILAYLPLVLKSLFSIFFSRGTASIKKVGLAEAGYSALFAVLFLSLLSA